MSNGRIIETSRLLMRRLTETDRGPVAELEWLDTDRILERSLGTAWPYGFLAVILKESGEFCGICGLLKQHLAHGAEIEVAYHFLPCYRGRGFATEAAGGVMDYAFEQLRHHRLVSLIRPDNLPSRRVAERNGLRHERDLMFHGVMHGMHVILKHQRGTGS
jgi:RimJ/RimL family protein N-acetyltransferase